MIGEQLAGRYQILRELGRGGMGVVFLATDLLLQREVAIKLVRGFHLDPALGERFRREARIIANMDHPGIVALYDIGEFQGSQFLVMPRIRGINLREFLRAGPVRLRDILEVGIQTADALEYSHGRGVVHRDVKPENVMVIDDKATTLHVRITDFGLAVMDSDSDDPITRSGALIGTIQYLSPEQISRRATIDGRADIYSLGTVIYECVAGEPPFQGEVASLIYQITHQSPRPLAEINSRIDPSLAHVIMKCLEKDPAARPQRARDLADALAECAALLHAENSNTDVYVLPTRHTHTSTRAEPVLPPMFGRDADIANLHRGLATAATGECQFILIGGDAGVGKSRLLDEVAVHARTRGIHVLQGRFFERDDSFPYQGFCDLIRDYFRSRPPSSSPPPTDLSDLASDLIANFPMLGEIEELRTASSTQSQVTLEESGRGAEDRTRIFELLARTLTRIGGGRPLAILLEDLHAATVSIDALQYVVRRLGPTPTFFAGTYRSTEIDKTHLLPALIDGFLGDRRFGQINLDALGEAHHRQLVASILGSQRVDEILLDRLFEATEGNPFFTRELVRSMIDAGNVSLDDTETWRMGADAPITSDSLPLTIQQTVEKRIDALSEPLRRILETASVLGRVFDWKDLEILTGSIESLDSAVDELVASGFIEEQSGSRGDLFRFSNGIVRDVLYASLPRRRRRSLHRQYAEHLERRHAGRLERVHAHLVHHFANADVADRVLLYGLVLARRMLQTFSANEAIHAARTVLEFLEEGDPSHGLIEAEARAVMAAAHRIRGNVDAALKEASEAIRLFDREGERSRSLATALLAAEIAWDGRRIEDARRWIDRGIDMAREQHDTAHSIRFLTLGATVANLRADYDRASRFLAEATRLQHPAGEEAAEIHASGGSLAVPLPAQLIASDPASIRTTEEAEVLCNVFETLITRDVQGNLAPSLCERWESREGGRSFSLTLRPDVLLADGRSLTATHVRESIESAIRRSAGSLPPALAAILGASELGSNPEDTLTGIEVDGDRHLTIHLIDSLPIYPALLTHPMTAIGVPSAEGQLGRVGTGPFRIEQISPQNATLVRNERWRGVSPPLDKIEFQAGVGAAATAAAFRAGQLDIARNLLPDDLEEIMRLRRLRSSIVEASKKDIHFVLLNLHGPLTHIAELRKALIGAVQTNDLVWRTLGRLAEPAHGLIPPGIPGHDAGRRHRTLTPRRVAELLEQTDLVFPIRLTASIHPVLQDRHAALIRALFRVWDELGIHIEAEHQSMEGYLERSRNNEGIDLLIGRFIADYDDPDTFAYGLFHSRHGVFRDWICSPELDALAEEARAVTEIAARERIYRKFETMLSELRAFLPLFHEIDFRIAGPRIRGLTLQSSPPFVNYAEISKTAGLVPPPVRRLEGTGIQVALVQEIPSIDPATMYLTEQSEVIPCIFDTLTRETHGSQIIPWLASDVTMEDGARRFRFHLRAARFHDGRRLTSRDVRYSFERLLADPEHRRRSLLAPIRGARAMMEGIVGDLEGFRIISATEFVIELEHPLSFFPAMLTYHAAAIIPEGTTTFDGTWREGTVGTGPFRVVRHEPGGRIDLEANPHYWRDGLPKIDRIAFHPAIHPAEIARRFRDGEVSLAWSLLTADADSLLQDSRLAPQFEEVPLLSTAFLSMNAQRGPLADEAVRHRVAAAISPESLVRRTLPRIAVPASSLIPPGLLGYEPGAHRIGRRSIVPGPEIELACAISPAYNGAWSDFAHELIEELRAAGFVVQIVAKTMTELYSAISSGTVDLVLSRWIGDYPDADTFLNDLISTREGVVGPLCGTAPIDELIQRGRIESDPSRRHAIYRETEELLSRHALLVPLFHPKDYRFARQEIDGFELSFTTPMIAYETLSLRNEK